MPRRRLTGHEAGDRVTLQARTTVGMRERMEAAAKATGRSLSQEMEMRLERSFERDDLRTLIREEIRAALAGRADDRLGMPEVHPGVTPEQFYRY